jgi:hypothetical protein
MIVLHMGRGIALITEQSGTARESGEPAAFTPKRYLLLGPIWAGNKNMQSPSLQA